MAVAKKKKTATTGAKKAAPKSKKVAKKKAPAKKKAAAPKTKAAKAASVDLKDLDRKALAAKARQLKTELLAIRFNLQSPSLKDYRNKKRELANVLSTLN